jgi:hypothetical protein
MMEASRRLIPSWMQEPGVAPSSEDIPGMAQSLTRGRAAAAPLHKGLAPRLAEFAVLLLRATAIILLLSPVVLLAFLLLR